MEKKNTAVSTGNKVAAGVGLAALAAAAAGAIFLYGTDAGKKKRKQIRSWSLKMQGDVLDRMEKMKDWSEESYASIVDTVAERYEDMKNVDPIELAGIVQDLKRHWKTLKRQVEATQKKPVRKAAPKKKPAQAKSEPKSESTSQ